MAVQNIAEISRSAKDLNSSVGAFRQIAANSNKEVSKIAKDLARTVTTQKRDIGDLANSIEETNNSLSQAASKQDATAAAVRESNSTQSSMLSEMKNVSTLLRRLNENFEKLAAAGGAGGIMPTASPTSMMGGGASKAMLGALGIGAAGAGGVYAAKKIGNAGPTFQENAPKLMNDLMKDYQLSKEQAAAIAGHWGHESAGLNPGINERNPLIPGSRGGYGLAQWTGPRRKALEKFAADNNMPVDSYDTQYAFFKKEISESKSNQKIIQNVRQSKTTDEAMQAFMPFQTGNDPRAIQAPGSRLGWANKAMEVYDRSQGNATTSVATPTTTAGSMTREAARSAEEGVDRTQQATQASVQIPRDDLIAAGKALQQMGFRVSEHPAFGGVNGRHSATGGHYEGRAFDVNVGQGNVEANDPVLGKKMDEIAKQLKDAGYNVLWRTPGHMDHLHASIGPGGSNIGEPGSMGGGYGYGMPKFGVGTGMPMGMQASILGSILPGMSPMGGMMGPMGGGMGAMNAMNAPMARPMNPMAGGMAAGGMIGGMFGGGKGALIGGLAGGLLSLVGAAINNSQRQATIEESEPVTGQGITPPTQQQRPQPAVMTTQPRGAEAAPRIQSSATEETAARQNANRTQMQQQQANNQTQASQNLTSQTNRFANKDTDVLNSGESWNVAILRYFGLDTNVKAT